MDQLEFPGFLDARVVSPMLPQPYQAVTYGYRDWHWNYSGGCTVVTSNLSTSKATLEKCPYIIGTLIDQMHVSQVSVIKSSSKGWCWKATLEKPHEGMPLKWDWLTLDIPTYKCAYCDQVGLAKKFPDYRVISPASSEPIKVYTEVCPTCVDPYTEEYLHLWDEYFREFPDENLYDIF